MKKKSTFEDYRRALIGVGDATKERILAEADKHLDTWQLERLVRIAHGPCSTVPQGQSKPVFQAVH